MTKKVLALLLSLVMMLSVLTVPALADERQITVIYNGEKLEFDVPPMLINGRTMVPMRAIFEALQATVHWNDYNQTVVGVSTFGDRIVTPIGSTTATINDLPVTIDSPPVLVNGRTLVPLRFISESMDCTVGWDDATSTVTIESVGTEGRTIMFVATASYSQLGRWIDGGANVIRGGIDTKPSTSPSEDAVVNFRVPRTGTYKVWVYANDYASDQQGTRFYNMDVNGTRSAKTFGQHGADGFVWEDGGNFELKLGEMNEIRMIDTSGWFARVGGIVITDDLDYIPAGGIENYQEYILNSSSEGGYIPANFPEWANGNIDEEQIETIENNSFKINFYKGAADKGSIVQSEIFMKRDGEWALVKDRTEDFGILGMYANKSQIMDQQPLRNEPADSVTFDSYNQTFETFNGEYSNTGIRSYYKTGKPEWLIPSTLEKVDDKTVKMSVASEHVSGTMTFSLGDLTDDPKVTFSANMKNDGAYSFTYFTGNDFSDKEFEKVTAPLHYIQDEIPSDASVIPESAMFTPMVAFTFDNNGKKFTKGVAVDPTSIKQYVSRLGDHEFGVLFRSPDGNARGQIVAPIFGTKQCQFNAGDDYTFSYRILYKDDTGYETLKHVATNLYNCVDLRENYYASMNETIYNMHDLIMDDLYSGWDERGMGFIDTEGNGTVSHSNFMAMVSQYLLTENEEFLEKRTIPSLAFALTRGRTNYQLHLDNNPYKLGSVAPFSGGSYVGIYQASQGRMPYLLNVALDRNANQSKTHQGATSYQAMNQLTNSDNYIVDLMNVADAYYEDLFGGDFDAISPFVHDTANKQLNVFLRAYEETNDEKYLQAAKRIGEYIMQQIWTTGYENGHATNTYTVDPEYLSNLYMRNDTNTSFGYAWKLGQRWRIGNPVGTWAPGKELQNKIIEESAPGFVPARTGMGTEHPVSPDGSRVTFMNNWAGSMLRLAKYTGDEFFATQARNTILGRSANYPGYYNDRLSLHDKRFEFPYEGPDFNIIFWHQIPSYLSILEDFLITDAWYRSDEQIYFPSVVNSGYAYFDNNDYGFAPGNFYDEEDMWLWLDRGIIEPDSVLLNYLPAKKDGVLGLALMNTDDADLTTTITLGEKIPNGASHNEKATLIDANGKKSTVDVVNGKFTVTIPAKGIMSVIMHPDVKKPSWVKDYVVSNNLGETISSFEDGKAYLMQFNDDNYFAYLCSFKKKEDLKSVTYTYTIGKQTQETTIDSFPFETIIKVPATESFEYKVTAVDKNGATVDFGTGKLSPLTEKQNSAPFNGNKTAEPINTDMPYFKPTTVAVKGLGSDQGKIRIVIANDELGFAGKLEDGVLVGAKIKTVFTSTETGNKYLVENMVLNTVVSSGSTVFVVEPYGQVKADSVNSKYSAANAIFFHPTSGTTEAKLYDEDKAISTPSTERRKALPVFEPFTLDVQYLKWGSHSGVFRFQFPISDFPFELSEDILKRCKITLTTTEAETGKVETHYTKVVANEIQGLNTIVVVTRPETISKDRESIAKNGIYSAFSLTFDNPDPLDFD